MKKKKREERIIKEFLGFKGCKIYSFHPREQPDALLIIKDNGTKKRIGIECTDYHNDALHGKPSPGMEIYNFWREVQSSICRRISRRPIIQGLSGQVSFDINNLRSTVASIRGKYKYTRILHLARALAEEIVRLALDHTVVMPDGISTIKSFSEEYPLLNKYLYRVIIFGTGAAIKMRWECVDSSVSSIGLSANEIVGIIKNKRDKIQQYDWNDVDERWLLISAPGGSVFRLSTAHPERVKWNSKKLDSAYASIDVDRIFFWDRTFNWYKQLRPDSPIVERQWKSERKPR